MAKGFQKNLTIRLMGLIALLMCVGISPAQAAPGDPGQASQTVTAYAEPRIAKASDGSFVLVSVINRNTNPPNLDVLAQRFDAAGVPVGAEFRVNTAEAFQRDQPRVAMAPDGRFVVAWREQEPVVAGNTPAFRLMARRFTAAGASQGQPFQLHTANASPRDAGGNGDNFFGLQLEMDGAANFVTTWLHDQERASAVTYRLETRRWAADGMPRDAAEVLVDSNPGVDARNKRAIGARLAVQPSGAFSIAYNLFREGEGGRVLLKRFNDQGVQQGETTVVTTGLDELGVFDPVDMGLAIGREGQSVVLWTKDRANMFGQRVSPQGQLLGAPFLVFNLGGFGAGDASRRVLIDDAGNLIAMVTRIRSSSFGRLVQVYTGRADGSAIQRPFSLLASPPREVGQSQDDGLADFVIDADGDALVLYTVGGQPNARLRRISLPAEAAAASPLTPPLKTNTYPSGVVGEPSVSVDVFGEKLITWSSSLRDNGAPGIYSQLFGFDGSTQVTGEARENLLTPEAEGESETLTIRAPFFSDRYVDANNGRRTAVAWRKAAVDDEGPAGIVLNLKRSGVFQSLPQQQLSTDAASGSPALAYAPGPLGLQNIGGDLVDDTFLIAAWREGNANGGAVNARFYRARPGSPVETTNVPVIAAAGGAAPTTVDTAMTLLGDSVVVWSGRLAGDTADQIYAQRYSGSFAAVGTPIRVSTAAAGGNRLPKVDMDSAGGFSVAWIKGSGPAARVAARRFDAAGTAVGDELTLGLAPPDNKAPGMAMDFDGDLVLAWLEGDSDVVFQQYRRNGEALGGVTSSVSGAGIEGPFTGVSVDANEDGDFTVAFSTAAAVYGRSYTVSADPLPLPLTVSTYTTSTTISPNNVQPSTPVTLRPMLFQGSFEACGNNLLNTRLPVGVLLRSVMDRGQGVGSGEDFTCTTVDPSNLSCTGTCGGFNLEVTAPSRPGRYRIATNAVVANGRDGATVQDAGTSNLVVLGPANGTLLFRSSEASASESVGTLNLLVDRINGSEGAVSIAYTTANGTAMAGSDYTAASGTLTWVANDAQPKNIAIPITPDTAVEGEETFTVMLSNATGGAASGFPDQVKVKLSDAQLPGTLVFSAASYSVVESGATATITVNRTGGASGTASVAYATGNGTATAGQDYTAANGTLSWADGDATAKTFTVAITNDTTPEADETVSLALSNATGATLGSPASATLTITNDDASPGTLAFSSASYAGSEAAAGRMVTVTVRRNGGSDGIASVAYASSNGTATAGVDYLASSGTLNWAAGDAADKTFTVTISDDSADEPDETVMLGLSNPTGAGLGAPATATLTIADDDEPGPDTTPDPFTFIDQTDVPAGSTVVSNTITVSGISAAASITVMGGEYRIGSGAFTAAAGSVSAGATVQVRHVSGTAANATINTVLTIGGVSDTFSSTTPAVLDTTPDTYSFRDQTGVPTNATITSNAVVIRGITAPVAISVSGTGGSYRIDGGAFVTAAGTVRNGQQVQLRHTSAPLPGQDTNTVLTVGGVSDTFSSTTGTFVQADTTPNAFDFADPVDVPREVVLESAAITVGGINTSTSIRIAGGEYSVDGAPYVSYESTVLNGQVVRVRHVTAAGFNASTTTTLTIGGVNGQFISTTAAADAVPDAFTFVDVTTRVEPTAVVVSGTLRIAGINSAAAVSITGGEYSIGCTTVFTAAAGMIQPDQTFCVRHTASSVFGAANETRLTIGGVSDVFSSRTRDGDSMPDAYTFADQNGVALSAVVVSAPVTIRGIEVAAVVSVTGGEYAIGCQAAAFTRMDGTVTAGQSICLRHTAAAQPSTATNTTLVVGGVSDVFTSVTVAAGPAAPADTTPDAFRFTDNGSAQAGATVTSDTISITGLTAAAAITVSGGQYSIGCAESGFTATAGTINNGQSVCVRHVASATAGDMVDTTLTIGGVADVFTSTTATATSCLTNDAPVFETGAPPSVQLDAELSYTLRVRSPTGDNVVVNVLGLPSCISLLNSGVDANTYRLSGLVGVGCALEDLTVRLTAQGRSSCASTLELPITLLNADRKELTDFIGRLVRVVANGGGLDGLQSFDAATQPTATLPGYRYSQGFFRGRIGAVPAKAANGATAKLAAGGVAQLSFDTGLQGSNVYVSCNAQSCQELPASTPTSGVLTVQLQDGGQGDTDGKADGVISFNGAPAAKTGGGSPIVPGGASGGGGGALGLGLLWLVPLLLRRGLRSLRPS